MSEWIDITRRLCDEMMLWPGRQPPQHQWERRIAEGYHCNVSNWHFNAHTGTHLDAPLHFFDDGAAIDAVTLESCIGPCHVLDLTSFSLPVLDTETLHQYAGAERLLIKTSHSTPNISSYQPHDALMTPHAAEFLIERGLKLIGTERLSIDDSRGIDFSLHHLFLGSGCLILEGLQLEHVAAGQYELYAAPLKLGGGEASPVRALLSR